MDGRRIAGGKLPALTAKPGAVQKVPLKMEKPALQAGQECFLTVTFASARATAWCEAGHEVAWEQFAMPWKGKAAARARGKVEIDGQTIRAGDIDVSFSPETGITALRRGGDNLLVSAPRLNVWRAATDNDGIKSQPNQQLKPSGFWLEAGLNAMEIETKSVRVQKDKTGAASLLIEQVGSCAGGAIRHRCEYLFEPGGRIIARNVFDVDKALRDLPRLGVTLQLRPGLEQLEWLGRGPHENYCDRSRGARVGLFRGTVSGQYVPYIVPQEHGNKTGVRWAALSEAGRGIRFASLEQPFEFSASHFTAEDLFAARHTIDLRARPEIIVNIDAAQRGLGTASCGPDTLPQYLIGPGRHQLDYIISVF